MKKKVCALLLTLFVSFPAFQSAFAQAGEQIVFVGADLLRGVGRYNGLTLGGGLNARYQHPLRANLALTVNAGVDYFRINYYYYVPSTYIGYGYNLITGYGFNTIYYGAGYLYPENTSGVSLPLTVGPRLYLPQIVPGLHTDLNVGVDVAATRTMLTSLHVSPGVGYALRLPGGRYLDLNLNYVTSFARGSGVFGLNAAYGLPLNR